MILSKEQQDAINTALIKNTYIASGPGSGKSTVLSIIAKKLLHEDNKVMLITFTNKSAKDIIGKVGTEYKTSVMGGTFHAIAYKLMKLGGLQFTICDENKKRLIIKKLFNCRKDKDKYEKIYKTISRSKSVYPKLPNECTSLYDAELAKYNMLDFDDIIICGIDHIKANIRTLDFNYILIDELQDTSQSQLVLLKELYKKGNIKVVGVGDQDQCQPAGNRILTTDGYINIENLDPNKHKLSSYNNHGKMYGLLKPNGYKFDISLRKFSGYLYTFNVENNIITCTYNHKVYVKWNTDKDMYCVYLMRKGDRFRIGQCRLFDKNGYFHLGIRSRIEKADSTWILKVCNTRTESLTLETYYSTTYRIPTITFKETYGTINFPQKVIDNIFSMLNTQAMLRDAITLLMMCNKSIKYPFWIASNYEKQTPLTFMKVTACNVFHEVMSMGVHESKTDRTLNITPITSLTRKYTKNITVYSLNVHKFHNYICSKLLISNSIYEWRGARPENVKEFINHFKCEVKTLGLNFRSKKNIVTHSRTLIEHNKNRIDKNLRANASVSGIVSTFRGKDLFKEIDYVVNKCRQLKAYNITILYRNRMNKMRLEYELRKNNLPYRVNDSTEITDRSAFRVILSILKISACIYDVYDLEEAVKGMMAIGTVTINRIKELKKENLTLDETIKNTSDKKIKRGIKNIFKIQSEFKKLRGETLDKLVEKIKEYIINSFNIPTDINKFLLDVTKEYHVTVNDVRDICNDFGLDNKEENNDEAARLELSTVHGFKGGQNDIIIIPFCDWDIRPDENTKNALEAERRLFYVAITRAKSELYLTYSGLTKPRFVREMLL